MSLNTGKYIRLGRILPNAGRGVCLAVDHGMQLGFVGGLHDLEAALEHAIEARLDAVILTPGALTRYAHLFAGRDRPAAIVRIDQTTMWRVGAPTGYDEGHTRLVSSVEEAMRLGADAVLSYFFVAHRDPALEDRMIEISGKVAQSARDAGMVYVAEPMGARNGKYEVLMNPTTVGSNARMATEIGADILKCDWPGSVEGCRQVVDGVCDTPVTIAGGPSPETDSDTIDLAAQLLAGGSSGPMFGRSFFQSANRLKLMKAIRAMVHENLPADQAKQRLKAD